MMIGTCDVRRSERATSIPSSRGSFRSRTISAGWRSRASASASLPLSVTTTEKPAWRR
jgi:hypothetical protein